MPRVDLVYERSCPNVELARANLMRAFARAGVPARWEEHEIGDPRAPHRVRGYGSPTIFVDGIDVAGMAPGEENSCRLYGHGPVAGAPPEELISDALVRATRGESARAGGSTGGSGRGRWTSTAAVLPGIGIALVPKVACPFCWPALAGVLGAAGLTFLMEDKWLLPISGVFLAAALGALGWRARSRRGYGPLLVGAAASIAIFAGKFAMASNPIAYAGVGVLLAACVWNAWPRRAAASSCPSCRRPEDSQTLQV